MKIQDINEKYFGKDPSKRYLIKALRGCCENLIATEITLRLHDEIKQKHICPNNKNVVASCAYCNNFSVMIDSYLDAAYLSARLVFAQKHKALASDFIDDVCALSGSCIEQYYHDVYDYNFINTSELENLQKLFISAKTDIKLKYKTIENYQTYKFHQPIDQVISVVSSKKRDLGGLKLNIVEKKPKQPNSTKELLDMLIDLANLIDQYSHLVSLPNINWRIPVNRTVRDMILLFSVNVSQEKEALIIAETENFIEPINRMLTCGTGLKSHNNLQFQKIVNRIKK